MSWFDGAGLTNFAKSALSNAQKSIDKVLDIQEDEARKKLLIASMEAGHATAKHSLESLPSSIPISPDKLILDKETFQAPTETVDTNDAENKAHSDDDDDDADDDDNAFVEEEDSPPSSSDKGKSDTQTGTPQNQKGKSRSRTATPKSRNSSSDGESFWGAFLDTSAEDEKPSPKKTAKTSTGPAFVKKGFGFGLAGKVWGSKQTETPAKTEDLGASQPGAESEKVTEGDERTKVAEDAVAKQQDDADSTSQTGTTVEQGTPEMKQEEDVTEKEEKHIEVGDDVDSGIDAKAEKEVEESVDEAKEETVASDEDVRADETLDTKSSSDDPAGKDDSEEDKVKVEDVDREEKTDRPSDDSEQLPRETDTARIAVTIEATDDDKTVKVTEEGHGEHEEKREHEREKGHEGDSKSDHSSEGHTTDDQSSSRSDSDFVVISDINGSAPSTNVSGSSPESASPKHFPISPGNGKRSPSDSEFSVISEDKLHESVHFDASCDADIPAMLADASINISQRTSPTDTSSSDIPKYSSGEEGSLKESADDEEEDTEYMDKTLTETTLLKIDSSPSALEAEKDDMMSRSQEDSSASMDSVKEVQITPDSVEPLEKDSLPEGQDHDHPPKDAEDVSSDDKFDPEDAVKSEKLLKDSDGVCDENHQSTETQQSEKFLEKLAEMAEVLQARENQVLSLSKDNVDLAEDNNILRNQLKQSEEAREAELEDLNVVTEEFTQRLTTMERKLQSMTKERDMLKKEVQITYQQLHDKSNDEKYARLLEEKDEQIDGLMQEGEKLSKQQLQNSNIIKKLRAKEKENEALIKSLKKQLDDSQNEGTHLRDVLDAKEDIDKKQKDGISKLNAAVEKQEKQIIMLSSDLEDAKEKVRSTQSALDASYKEIAELHRTIASKESKIQEAQLSAEMSAKEETRFALEKAQQEAKYEQEGLAIQVNDLRMSMTRAEQQFARKEDNLRQEIVDLQQRLQEAEYRNQELSQSVTAATRPLLRQIENLQATFTTQSSSWERVEKSLTERLNEAQTQLAAATEKDRMVAENTMEMNSKLATLESQVMMLRQEKIKLAAQLEMEKSKVESLEDFKNKEAIQLDAVRSTYSKAIEDLERDKALLEKQVEMEKLKVDTERKKLMLAQESLKDKEKRVEELSLNIKVNSRPETPVISRSESFTSEAVTSTPILPTIPLTQGDILEQSMTASMSGSIYDGMMTGSATAIMESLQSQVKQRDGEIAQLQSTITQLERTRTSMAEELVNLSNTNESLEEEVSDIPEMQRKLLAVEHKYNAVLQMYGEKAEEAEELKLDLQDVKAMYRQQIEELLKSK